MTQQTSQVDASPELIDALGSDPGAHLSAVQNAIPSFKKFQLWDTFDAEYAMTEGNIVLHFFQAHDSTETLEQWKARFADALVKVAPDYFHATAPRLVASYTEEMRSWWVRALNYGHILDLDAYLLKFLNQLDASLDAKS